MASMNTTNTIGLNPTTVGVIGLGRMGLAIASRLLHAGHAVIGFDPDEQARKNFDLLQKNLRKKSHHTPATSTLTDLPISCPFIWLMVPAGKIVDDVLEQIVPHVQPKTIIIDGGNSHFPDTVRRAQALAKKNIFYLDCGTSGGLKGKEIGFSLMIGGNEQAYKKAETIFAAIAAPSGYGYMGPSGAGHYVKMVHNGIEYSLLQSYAEGLNLLKHGSYKNLDLALVTQVWSNGSVIRSWIVDLLQEIFATDQDFATISGAIGENFTGQWTLAEAKKQNIDMSLLQHSLKVRALSRESGGDYATKLIALLRNKFGGHPIKNTPGLE